MPRTALSAIHSALLFAACGKPPPLPPPPPDTTFPEPDTGTTATTGCPVEGIGDLNVGMSGFDRLDDWEEAPSVEILAPDGTSYAMIAESLNFVNVPVGEWTLLASRGKVRAEPGARAGELWTAERPIRRVCVDVGEDLDVDFVWEEHQFSGALVAAVANQAVAVSLAGIDAGTPTVFSLAAPGAVHGTAVDRFGIVWAAVEVGGRPELFDLNGDVERWLASDLGATTPMDLVVDADDNLLMLTDGPDFVGLGRWTPEARIAGILDDTTPQPEKIPIATIHPTAMALADDGTPRIGEESGRVLLIDSAGYILGQIDPTSGGDVKTGLEAFDVDGDAIWAAWTDDTVGSFVAGLGEREIDPIVPNTSTVAGIAIDAMGAVWWVQQGVGEGKVTRYEDDVASVLITFAQLDGATRVWLP
jgi:hypothetical protein